MACQLANHELQLAITHRFTNSCYSEVHLRQESQECDTTRCFSLAHQSIRPSRASWSDPLACSSEPGCKEAKPLSERRADAAEAIRQAGRYDDEYSFKQEVVSERSLRCVVTCQHIRQGPSIRQVLVEKHATSRSDHRMRSYATLLCCS